MIRRCLLALVASTALAAPALALQEPQPGPHDPRMRVATYRDGEVYRVVGTLLSSTQITFAPGEMVGEVSNGDALAWAVAKAGNVLFLKPVVQRQGPTSMQVLTTKPDGSRRSYVFELASRDGSVAVGEPAYFGVSFAYPEDARREAAERAGRLRRAATVARNGDRLETAIFAGPRNWRYTAQGSASIEPAEVSDDGRLTAFRFPANTPLPGLYIVGADGGEALVPSTVRGDLVVVNAVSREWRLRLGGAVLCIHNQGFAPSAAGPGTGTISPDVTRELKEARQ